MILQARALDDQGHPDSPACWARLRTLAAAGDYAHPDDPEVGPLVRLRADLLDDEANRAGDKDDFAVAQALYEEAAGLYEDAAAPGQAALARACALLAAAEGVGDEAEARAAALTAAHASIVALHEGTSGLAPVHEARLLRLRATTLGLRLQKSGNEEDVAPVFAEVDLLLDFATRHDVVGQISGGLLLRAGTHALSGDLPAAVTGVDDLLDRLKAHGPAWHMPRALGLRGGSSSASGTRKPRTRAWPRACDWPPPGRPRRSTPAASTVTWPRSACTWAGPTRHCAT